MRNHFLRWLPPMFRPAAGQGERHVRHNVVVAAFIYKGGKVLVAKRAGSKQVAPGRYHLPGGHVRFDENAIAALEREIREEFGVRVRVGEPFHVFSYTTSDQLHTVGIVFFASLQDGTDSITLNGRDNECYAWVPREAIRAYFHSAADHNLDAVLAGFERLNARGSLGLGLCPVRLNSDLTTCPFDNPVCART